MIKRLFAASSLIVAAALVPVGAAPAAPSWSNIGQAELPNYGRAELFVGKFSKGSGQMVSGQMHASLAQPWTDPQNPGRYSDVYFKVLADCGQGTVAVMPTWPEGPDVLNVSRRDLRRPAAGSAEEKLLKAYCS